MHITSNVLWGLRILTGAVIVAGLIGFAAGLYTSTPLRCFGAAIPAWAPGMAVVAIGFNRWPRIARIQREAEL